MPFIAAIFSKTGLKVIAILLVIGAAYGLYHKYTQTLAQNQELETALQVTKATLEAERAAQKRINEAVDINAKNTDTIVRETHTIEEKVRQAPKGECGIAPPVAVVLDELRRQERETTD